MHSCDKIHDLIKSSSKSEIEIPSLMKLNDISVKRLSVLLKGYPILIFDGNYENYNNIANELGFIKLQNFLTENINKSELQNNYELLTEIETLFKTFNDNGNESLLNQIFQSIICEFGKNLISNLILNIAISKYKLIPSFLDFVEKNGIEESFLSEFRLKKDEMLTEYFKKFYGSNHNFSILGDFAESYRIYELEKNIAERKNEEFHDLLDGQYKESFYFVKNDDIDQLQRLDKVCFTIHRFMFCQRICNCFDIAAFYGSIKCFRYLLTTCKECFTVNPTLVLLGQDIEILQLSKQNDHSFGSKYPDELESAIFTRDLSLFIWICEQNPRNQQLIENDPKLGLYLAYCIKTQNYELFNYLIDLIDFDNPPSNLNVELIKWNMFYQICFENNHVMLDWYLRKFHEVSRDVVSDVFCAAFNVKPDLSFIHRLLDFGIDSYKAYGSCPLHYACIHNNLDLAKKFLQMNRAMLNIPEFFRFPDKNFIGNATPLMIAVIHGHVKIVEFLLKQKDLEFDVYSTSTIFMNTQAFILAYYYGNYQILKLMNPFLKDIYDPEFFYYENFHKKISLLTVADVARMSKNKKVISHAIKKFGNKKIDIAQRLKTEYV
ncbi:hypothetical protein TRFO_02644 [Tritrichomonas foetus]|uniref:Uncharacterized protein n=1 Tax=Tritrichomonas foetus TaxID=1144522 RepID=A0A1J4L3B5_9EUKA|nr:hypothetical protein TRFO_02644 [Tritrichomonas foetus]|eukprot:OHT16405.1 hypothetical protein TRFO_02644 [Tritrichomonas foetus]